MLISAVYEINLKNKIHWSGTKQYIRTGISGHWILLFHNMKAHCIAPENHFSSGHWPPQDKWYISYWTWMSLHETYIPPAWHVKYILCDSFICCNEVMWFQKICGRTWGFHQPLTVFHLSSTYHHEKLSQAFPCLPTLGKWLLGKWLLSLAWSFGRRRENLVHSY